jgi:CheY-like chemotaxis protein
MPHRILLVDDNDAFCCACANLLANAGLAVEATCDWKKALQILSDQEPLSLLIADIRLPIHGLALARMAHTRRPAPPELMIAAVTKTYARNFAQPVPNGCVILAELVDL